MKFKIEIENATIIKAAEIVMKHYKDGEFLCRVIDVDKFNYSQDNGVDVARKIVAHDVVMTIKCYKTWNPWSNVIGYAEGSTIYCNSRKFNLPLLDRIENFFHEPLHLMGYSHKGNYNNEFNRGTVPYKVAAMFREYVKEKGLV